GWARAMTAVFAITVTGVGGSALAADPWAANGGKECDDTAFKNPTGADIPTLSRCAKMWQAYGNTDRAKGDYRTRVVTALKRLYAQGDDRDAKVAQNALNRMGETDLPQRAGAAGGGTTTPTATRVEPAKPARKRFA